MRLSSAGTRASSRSSYSSQRSNNATKSPRQRLVLNDDSVCVDEISYPGMQLNIPHMKDRHPKSPHPLAPKHSHGSRHSSPSTTSTSVRRMMVEPPLQDDEAVMLQFLNRQQQVRRTCMPETWSVKLPAYHHQSQSKPIPLRNKCAPSNSMFRGNAKVSTAVASSFDANADDIDPWLAERREPFATIEEKDDRRKWKRWFLN